VVAASALALIAPAVAASEAASEYEVKAAFLFNFAKYVAWPEGTFRASEDPIVICVLGGNPFGTLLESAIKDKKVNGRTLAIREPKSVSATEGCHIVFLASSERPRVAEVLAGLAVRPVLTISEDPVAEPGPILGLTLKGKRVCFEVNLTAARRAGLKLSSQLLKVAVRLVGQVDAR
jgi:hypothetical protein